MITKEEVKHIAGLARLGINDAEVVKMQKDLSSVLAYAKKLIKVDVSGVEPTSHPLKVENAMRGDKTNKWPKKLLDGFLKVKSIF